MTNLISIAGTDYHQLADGALVLLRAIAELEGVRGELYYLLPAAGEGHRLARQLVRQLRLASGELISHGEHLRATLAQAEQRGPLRTGEYLLGDGVYGPRNEVGRAAIEIFLQANPVHRGGLRIGQHPAPIAKALNVHLDRPMARLDLAEHEVHLLGDWRRRYVAQLAHTQRLASQLREVPAMNHLWAAVRTHNRLAHGGLR
jgi:hypothetical protein